MSSAVRNREDVTARFFPCDPPEEAPCSLCGESTVSSPWVVHSESDHLVQLHLKCLVEDLFFKDPKARKCFHCHQPIVLEPTDLLTQAIARHFLEGTGSSLDQLTIYSQQEAWQNAIARCDESGFLKVFSDLKDPALKRQAIQKASSDFMLRGKFLIALYEFAKNHPDIQEQILYNCCFKGTVEEIKALVEKIDPTQISDLFLHSLARLLLEEAPVKPNKWEVLNFLISCLAEENQKKARVQVLGVFHLLRCYDLIREFKKKWPEIEIDKREGQIAWQKLVARAKTVPPSFYSYPVEISRSELQTIPLDQRIAVLKGVFHGPKIVPNCANQKQREKAIAFLGGFEGDVFLLPSIVDSLQERYSVLKEGVSSEDRFYKKAVKISITCSLVLAGLVFLRKACKF